MTAAVKCKRLGPGLYRDVQGCHEVEHIYGHWTTDSSRVWDEWRLFEVEDGERGEWCNTFYTRRDALEVCAQLHAER